MQPTAGYIHVPFCAYHCGYCDFAVAVGQDYLADRYLEALEAEIGRLGEARAIDTLFFGGGTPTHLSAGQLERLLEVVLRWLPLKAGHEFSVEANPTGLDAEKVNLLADHGVNRVSLGAQSFNPATLKTLERDHRPEEVGRAVERVRRRIDNMSLDLIFGVPGQSLEDWRRDLETALKFEPDHIATYGLTYEKGTKLWRQSQGGEVTPLAEDSELAMYELAMDFLEGAGFVHYEISNFARPGRECRHNQVYWANEAYFGFGVGAASYVNGCRKLNTRELAGYMKKVLAGEDAAFQSECLEPRERAMETMAVQLRRGRGVDRASFVKQTGFGVDELVGGKIVQLVGLGLLEDVSGAVRLTRRGKCVGDGVIGELYAEPPVVSYRQEDSVFSC